mmetsp:Transcript_66506/g.205652  ORF Transcript_66506/g.205652 Transcript_66506/m.205652 type:complete len:214 (-) Transcript_66506:347-988(-)
MSILYSRPPGQAAPSGTTLHWGVGTNAGPLLCSRGISPAASAARACMGSSLQHSRKPSQAKCCPDPPALSFSKVGDSSPRPEPDSKASWMARSRASNSAPPSSTLVTGRPKRRRTGGCFLRAMRTSRWETWPLPPRSRRSKSFRARPSSMLGVVRGAPGVPSALCFSSAGAWSLPLLAGEAAAPPAWRRLSSSATGPSRLRALSRSFCKVLSF